jgi:hypothetical protein
MRTPDLQVGTHAVTTRHLTSSYHDGGYINADVFPLRATRAAACARLYFAGHNGTRRLRRRRRRWQLGTAGSNDFDISGTVIDHARPKRDADLVVEYRHQLHCERRLERVAGGKRLHQRHASSDRNRHVHIELLWRRL